MTLPIHESPCAGLCGKKSVTRGFNVFKAALINIFIVTMDQIITFNVKGVAHSDKRTENYPQALQFTTALQSL